MNKHRWKILLMLIVPLLIAAVIIPELSNPVYADAQLSYITDTAGILTEEEDSELESLAKSASEEYQCGIYIVTVNEYTDYGNDIYTVAYGIYHQYDLGLGSDRNGVILLMSMNDRKYATFFYGPTAEYAFNSYGQEKIEEEFLPDFGNDDWAGGFRHFINACGNYLSLAAEGHPVRRSPWPRFFMFLGIACGISLVICLIFKAQLRSVRPGTEARSYIAGGLNLTGKRDIYTHTTRTSRKIEHEHSSGSSGGGSSPHTGGGGSGRSGSF